MKRKEYQRMKTKLSSLLVDFQIENDIKEEWLLRMLLEISQASTVKFDEGD